MIQLLRLPDGTVKVLVEGKSRAQIKRFVTREPFFSCEIEEFPEPAEQGVEVEALVRTVHSGFENYVKLNKKTPPETLNTVRAIKAPGRLADTIVAHLSLKLEERQDLLEMASPSKRLEEVYARMQAEIEVFAVERKIRGRVKKQMERSQKEYYLNEQMRAIQKELGERDEFKNEVDELEEQLKKKKMPKEAKAKAEKEVRKLKMMSPMSAEATVVRNYVDWMLSLPWEDYKEEKRDIVEAERVLDEDHYGLEKPKERIIEYLAVQALVERMKGPILCLVGPPGVGKTSLGKSIARATGRDFVRVSLGGVRDEAEIRGHRRTYIGALPGKILQSLKKAGSGNPVFLLDEVDKMSMDFRGDPSAALLEVLDPEQNHTFNDHYLDVDYDLSRVMFVCTANVLSQIPRPLQDRMEIIQIPGYIESEKLQIARDFLVPKVREANGLKPEHIDFSDAAILELIRHYTRESGVRSLERELASICRKIAREVVKAGENATKAHITPARVKKLLGVQTLPLRQGRGARPRGRVHRARLHRSGRRAAPDRGVGDAGQGQAPGHRTARRGDAGIRERGALLHPLARQAARPHARFLLEGRHPHPRARGRHAEGRPVGRHHDRDRDRLGADAPAGALERRDDGRDHAARPRAADRRAQGEDDRGAPGRDRYAADPQGEREGSRRDPRQHQAQPEHHPRRAHGRRAARGARPRTTRRGCSTPATTRSKTSTRCRRRSSSRRSPSFRAGRE